MTAENLPAALDRLHTAIAALTDPRKELHDHVLMAAPSLYDELLSELPAVNTNGTGYTATHKRSMAPVWLDALDLRTDIDRTIRKWHPTGTTTPARLHAHAARNWRPQDARLLEQHANELQAFAVSIRSLLDPAHVKHLNVPCPACNATHVYRRVAGESVRQPALQLIAETGCTCQQCKAFWSPQHYLLLCKVLGFDLPAGVLN